MAERTVFAATDTAEVHTADRHAAFGRALTADVQAYRQQRGTHAPPAYWLKAGGLVAAWGAAYWGWLSFGPDSLGGWLCGMGWFVMGLLLIFNIGHDAVHGTLSPNDRINRAASLVFNMVGGNAYSWRMKHNLAHHLHTNIEGLDFDTEMDPLMRVSPESPHRPQYRFQVLTAALVYPLLSLLILLVADFSILPKVRAAGLIERHPPGEWAVLVASKAGYLFLALGGPVAAGWSWVDALGVFLAGHLLCGLLIAAVFQPSHYFPESQFAADDHNRPNWFALQTQTTMDIAPNSRWLTAVLGGLNHNVTHHLFPQFFHGHYPALSRMVRQRAAEWDIPLHERGFLDAQRAHLRHLRTLSRP